MTDLHRNFDRHIPKEKLNVVTDGSQTRDRLGRPLRDLRVSLTDECNFRCTYCMPEELFGEGHPFLPPDKLLSFPEIMTVVQHAVTLGVQKIKLTGGEPLLRPGVHRLVRQLTDIPELTDIGLITNGFHLSSVAQRLLDAGLRRVTVSLDSISAETFDQITGRSGGLKKVLEAISDARRLGFDPVKVNMVVQRGVNDHEVLDMAHFARAEGVELRYIEYMDVGSRRRFEGSLVVPNREIRDQLNREFGITPMNSQYFGEVADTYRYANGLRVGFISSMTQPFCGSCTRLRLAADGTLYRCLFSGIGLGLRPLLRDPDISAEEIVGRMRAFWGVREDRYSELRAGSGAEVAAPSEERVEMYRMGG